MYKKPIFSFNIARKTAKFFTAKVLFDRQVVTSVINFTRTS
jgi:hypothetical protein